MRSLGNRFLNSLVSLGAFANLDGVARLHQEARHIALSAIYRNVSMQHHLARLRTRSTKTHTVDHIVQAAFEQLQQVLAGDALHLRGLLEVVTELAFED